MRLGISHSLSSPPVVPVYEPDLVLEHKNAIIRAIRWAWSELVIRDPNVLRTHDEEAITNRIQSLLNERFEGRRVAKWLSDFETVTRGESQTTADGRIQKKPDLTFRPMPYGTVVNSTRWGWFVECKIIDGPRSVTAYRDKGIQRFCNGEYAPWMQSGAMLAYVRDGSTPMVALGITLKGFSGLKNLSSGLTGDQSDSEHDRSKEPKRAVDGKERETKGYAES